MDRFVQGADQRHGRVGSPALKVLEDENAKLKRMLANSMLDNGALKDCWKSGDGGGAYALDLRDARASAVPWSEGVTNTESDAPSAQRRPILDE